MGKEAERGEDTERGYEQAGYELLGYGRLC